MLPARRDRERGRPAVPAAHAAVCAALVWRGKSILAWVNMGEAWSRGGVKGVGISSCSGDLRLPLPCSTNREWVPRLRGWALLTTWLLALVPRSLGVSNPWL